MRNHRSHYLGAEEKARIEIIPMIDIMMFLLVFFMLATLKMIQGAGIKLDLPQSSTAEQLQQTVKVSIGVTKTDEIYLDAKPVTPTELTAHLQGSCMIRRRSTWRSRATKARATRTSSR